MDFDAIVAALMLGVAGLPVASLVWKKTSGKILALVFALSSGAAFAVFFLAHGKDYGSKAPFDFPDSKSKR